MSSQIELLYIFPCQLLEVVPGMRPGLQLKRLCPRKLTWEQDSKLQLARGAELAQRFRRKDIVLKEYGSSCEGL